MKIITYNNYPDIYDSNGFWIKSTSKIIDNVCHQYRTRAYNVWMSINGRKNNSYVGFADFQEFATWCQSKEGYLNVDTNGKFWSIDKDLKFPGNLEYNRDKCMFIPARINSLFNCQSSINSNLPIGVHFDNSNCRVSGKYVTTCR